MDFMVHRDELTRALGRVQGIVEKRPATPILAAVLLRADADGLHLSATDKSITLVAKYAATVNVPGEVAIEAGNFFQVAKVLAGDVVTVKLADNGRLDVSAGKSHFRLATLPAQDFPVTPALEQPRVLTMDAAALRSVIDRTLFSVAGDDNRYGLNGAHVEDTSAGAGPVVRFVSTDGNRLSWAQAPYTGELAIGRKMLLPRKGLDQFRRLLDGAEGLVELGFGERAALARWEGISLHLRLLEADFPDYRQVLPTSFRRKAIADREALASALRRVAILATDQSNSVKFQFLAESVQLSARKLDAGDSEEELPIDFSGDSVALGFNARFVLEVLSAMHGERVIIELGDALHPCVLRDPGDDSALFVVMPVRLD